ncbi:chaperonin 10-like protein [Flammula alnicola]|nr:chaperonin 10-like protein [Flammula alnicola]
MPATAKALLIPKKYAPLVVGQVSVRKAGPGEILIKIQSTSLNPIDWKIHKWGIVYEDFPAILGNDIAGDVEEVGAGVTDFKIGDRVFGQGHFKGDRGSFQQYVIALASTTAKIPPNVSYDEASTIPTVLTAAYVGLYNQNPHGLGLDPPISDVTQGQYAGTPIVVIGGASSVGQIVIQLAKLSGFSPIITTASLKHTELLKSLGATAIFDRNLASSALASEITKIVDSRPIKLVYDAISLKDTQQLGLDLLAPGGQLAVVIPPSVTPIEERSVVHVLGILRLPHNIALLETLYHDKLHGFVEQGIIKPNGVEVLPNGLAGIPEGLDRMEADLVSRSKLVAHPQETP